MINKRPEITKHQILQVVQDLIESIGNRIEERGSCAFASKHEILGIITEEVKELIDVIHKKGDTSDEICSELMDIAVGAVFGITCIQYNKVDW
jgi:NTP pyrophosphatase (non-canonical NTP hydrolase)